MEDYLTQLADDLPVNSFVKADIIQGCRMLDDLGYIHEVNPEISLSELLENPEEFTDVVKKAIEQFRFECGVFIATKNGPFTTKVGRVMHEKALLHEHLSEIEMTDQEVKLLSELSGFDESLNLSEFDTIKGRLDLMSRVIHRRLALLGLVAWEAIYETYSDSSDAALDRLALLLGSTKREAIASLSDIEQIARGIRQTNSPLKTLDVVFAQCSRDSNLAQSYRPGDLATVKRGFFTARLNQEQKTAFREQIIEKITEPHLKQTTRLKNQIARLKARVATTRRRAQNSRGPSRMNLERELRKLKAQLSKNEKLQKRLKETVKADAGQNPVLQDSRDFSYVEARVHDLDNVFLLRVYQILMWTYGFYPGDIDGIIGKFTVGAIENLIKTDKEIGDGLFPIKNTSELLVYIGRGYWALNFDVLTSYFDSIPESNQDIADLLGESLKLDVEFDSLSPEEKQRIEEIEVEVAETVKEQGKLLMTDRKRAVKTTPAKTKIGRFFRRVVDAARNVVQRVGDFFKRLFNFIKGAAREVFDFVRKILKRLANGFKFLFGKRAISSADGTITSDFDFDYDLVTTISSPQATTLALEAHTLEVKAYVSDLRLTFRFVGKAINLVTTLASATNPLGWAKLAIKLFQWLRTI